MAGIGDWIKNTGTKPVESGTMIDAKYLDGHIELGVRVDDMGKQYGVFEWTLFGTNAQITHWRHSLVVKNPYAGGLGFPEAPPKTIGDLLSKTKDTNPKEQIGLAKLPLHLWSPLASAYGSLGLLNGMKYGYGNYKATPVLASIYIAAIKRHLSAWEEGQECDPVDGVPHFGAILANVAILLESRAVGTMVDDRQIRGGYLKEVEKLTEIANSVQELHKDRKPYHYSIKDSP